VRDTETFGFWLDTVNRQKGGTTMFDHWMDTLYCQRWVVTYLVTGLTQ